MNPELFREISSDHLTLVEEHYLLRELRARLQTDRDLFWLLTDEVSDGIWYFDLENEEEAWLSKGFRALFGYTEEEMPNSRSKLGEFIHPDDVELAYERYRSQLDNAGSTYGQLLRYKHKDGGYVWVRSRGLIIRNPDGKPIRMLGIHADVTGIMEAREASRRSAALSRAVLESVDAGILHLFVSRAADGSLAGLSIIDINTAAQTLLGVERDVVVSNTVDKSLPRFIADRLLETYAPAGSESSEVLYEQSVDRDGEDQYVRVSGRLCAENQIVVSLTDISASKRAQKNAEKQRRKFERLYNKTPMICHSSTERGELLFVSDSWLEAFQYERHEVIGRKIVDFLTPEVREQTEADRNRYYQERGFIKDLPRVWRRKDGSTFEGELSAQLFRGEEGEEPYSLAVIVDVTERNQARRELERTSESLRSANRQLEDFASIASHDLQAPLRRIVLTSDLLEEALEAGDMDDVKASIERIRRMGSEARLLVQNVLAFARVLEHQVSVGQVDLHELVKQIADDYALDETQDPITIRAPDAGSYVMADLSLMRMLLINLIGNGVKYARKDAESFVDVSLHRVDTGGWCLTVADNGVGFDVAEKARMFEAFQRLKSSVNVSGSGIGLSICKRVCDRHGWTIDCTSKAGEGSTFIISIP